jgi:MoaA/NifB/PqqE/SkfB family radical SAM enzyme
MSVPKTKYDAWLHWSVSDQCIMNCDYCSSGRGVTRGPRTSIDIQKLIATLDRTDKIFRIGISGGGEPFLVPNLVEACIELSKKHYLSFNSNFAEKRVREFIEKIDPQKVIYIIASCHIKALERRNLLETFINNFLLAKEKGINIRAVEVAYHPIINEIDKYRKLFASKGIQLDFNEFCGRYNDKDYPKAYTDEELDAFGFRRPTVKIHYPDSNKHKRLCNAGYNVAYVNSNGDITPCESIKRIIGNIYEKIEFHKSLMVCPFKSCTCPLYLYDEKLFQKALYENRWHLRRQRIKETIFCKFALLRNRERITGL